MTNAISSNTKRKGMYYQSLSWSEINWRKVERKVYKLQKRIYKATQEGNHKKAKSLQKTLINSWSAKALAVKRVTQENRGKKTAGVDGIKQLTPNQRLKLVDKLKLKTKSKPVKRVWIPKPGKDEKRPLGIPTIEERARQALVKMALEPEWEAKFEPNSYGFRPAKSTHDACGMVFSALSKSEEKWVLDADISGCFDNINHQYLLDKINATPKIRRQIKAWLKSGVIDFEGTMDNKGFSPTSKGTPQGGIISPLLANIALHGLETNLKEWLWNHKKYRKKYYNTCTNSMHNLSQQQTKATLVVVRYADDFVVIHEDREIIEECREVIQKFLTPIGLRLREDKTSIKSSREGFDFLGFNFKQYKTGLYRSNKLSNGKPTGYTTLIKPSRKSVKEHYARLAEIIDHCKSAPQEVLIKRLNPIIKGWANYYRFANSKDTFGRIDHLLFWKLRRWARRRHPQKSRGWVDNKYFHTMETNKDRKWEFSSNNTALYSHSATKIERYIRVQGHASIYDGNEAYWAKRVKNHPTIRPRVLKLMNRQKGICPYCRHSFRIGDIWEIDHIVPRHKRGKDHYDNLQLLHLDCHDRKTKIDLIEQGTQNEDFRW